MSQYKAWWWTGSFWPKMTVECSSICLQLSKVNRLILTRDDIFKCIGTSEHALQYQFQHVGWTDWKKKNVYLPFHFFIKFDIMCTAREVFAVVMIYSTAPNEDNNFTVPWLAYSSILILISLSKLSFYAKLFNNPTVILTSRDTLVRTYRQWAVLISRFSNQNHG